MIQTIRYISVGIFHIPPLDPAELSTLITSLGHLPDEYVISEFEVFEELLKIKLRKSVGPVTIPHKLLKNLADIFGAPVTAIINASLRQGIVPELWKISRVTV